MSIFSKRSLEGEVMIDHRNSPGVTPEFIQKNNLDAPAVGSGQTYKSAFCVCHGCGGNVLLEPKRTRERGYCWKHDAYLCDNCTLRQKLGDECIPIRKRMEDAYTKAIHGQAPIMFT